MAAYNWEEGGRKHKAIKAAGTVVFNPNDRVSPAFADCKELSSTTVDVLSNTLGFKELLPAQAITFKGISNGRDIILHSRTGSGKTLAYALPLLERFLREKENLSSAAAALSVPASPYVLIFVFGNELAVQTKTVINSVYGDRVSVAVAGFDVVTQDTPVDVLIGTLPNMDHLIRGASAAAAANGADSGDDSDAADAVDDDDDEDDHDEGLVDVEDEEAPAAPAASSAPAAKAGQRRERDGADGLRYKRQHRAEGALTLGIVSLARVRTVVVDECDATLGPKFSRMGRRFKNLLKVIRRSNGSLTKGLTSDFRMHHYVLCGATIPNWIIKAGFLGVKKYYYRLVTAGDAKLPAALACYTYACAKKDRIATTAELVLKGNLGRTVIFTTGHRIALVETALKAALHDAAQAEAKKAAATNNSKNSGRKSSGSSSAVAGTVSSIPVLRTLSSEKDESERIAHIEDFNSGAATVLLCTDAAARGLDFVAVDTVLMETLPDHIATTETFVHRAGRTARVASVGKTILLYDATTDTNRLAQLESVLHVSFKAFPKVGAAEAQTARLSLRVRQTMQASKAVTASVVVASPKDVLAKLVDPAVVVAIHDTDSADRIEFDVVATAREDVRKALWKYDVKVLA